MAGFENLSREFEARRYPVHRRLDVHGEGPTVARQRALHWIQSYAHEAPGTELLLIVERGGRPGSRAGPVRLEVEKLLRSLVGGLIDWWTPFGDGSLSLRVSTDPRMVVPAREPTVVVDPTDGRTPETAGAAHLPPDEDIPEELLPLALLVTELRRSREGLSLGLEEVVLRRVWIETQAAAMDERIPFEAALARLLEEERKRAYEEEG
jgi:hypothetical protein